MLMTLMTRLVGWGPAMPGHHPVTPHKKCEGRGTQESRSEALHRTLVTARAEGGVDKYGGWSRDYSASAQQVYTGRTALTTTDSRLNIVLFV